MYISKTLPIVVLLFLMPGGYVHGAAWRGIVPLRSTRADVERVLGSPLRGYDNIYDADEGRVNIFYQRTPCVFGDAFGRSVRGDGWKVPRDTVIDITVYPKTRIMLADLRIDESKYRHFSLPHDPAHIHYTNEEEGLGFTVFVEDAQTRVVQSFNYHPAKGDDAPRCLNTHRAAGGAHVGPRKLDEYSVIPIKEEKRILDNFALELRRSSDVQGLIIFYEAPPPYAAPPQDSVGEVSGSIPEEWKLRVRRALQYLVRRHRIPVSHVTVKSGGVRRKVAVELYLVPLGAENPRSTPDYEP